MEKKKAFESSELWAITAYFNPIGYRRRLLNYRAFRAHLPIPLVTVEIGYGSRFDLQPDDAEILISCPGQDVMWQKERLLNVALAAVPAPCRAVVMVDCDVILQPEGWPARTLEALDRVPLVQPFGEAFDQSAMAVPGNPLFPELEEPWPAFASCRERADELLVRETRQTHRRSHAAMGLAWAFRRELHEECPIYDACILGGGNHAVLCAACDCPEVVIEYQQMNAPRRGHYLRWAERLRGLLEGRMGSVPGQALHLWHGDRKDRGYGRRYRDFTRYDFDPEADIEIDRYGCWRWSSPKPQMHQYVHEYFVSRREDG